MYIITFVILFIMSGMRGISVGGDLRNYIPEFETVARTSSIASALMAGYHEPGYVLFLKLLGLISADSRCFLLGTAFCSLIGPFVLFNKYSKDGVTSILLYYAMGYYTNTFNNVRQSLALSIIFLSIPFLVDRKFWKYLIGVVIATSFHYSAIVMLLVYPLSRKILTTKHLLLYAGLGLFVSYFLFYYIFGYVAQYFIFKFDPESIMENNSGGGYGLFAFYVLVFIAVSFFYFANRKYWDIKTQLTMSLIVLFQLLTMVIQLAAPKFHSMMRMAQYLFIPFATIAIPYIHGLIKNKFTKQTVYFVAYAYAIYRMTFYVYSYNPETGSNSQNVIPYVFGEIVLF